MNLYILILVQLLAVGLIFIFFAKLIGRLKIKKQKAEVYKVFPAPLFRIHYMITALIILIIFVMIIVILLK